MTIAASVTEGRLIDCDSVLRTGAGQHPSVTPSGLFACFGFEQRLEREPMRSSLKVIIDKFLKL